MTKKQAWSMFLSFLDIAGFNVVPGTSPRRYRVISSTKALKAPEPAYIGVDPKTLPDDDQMIRYVYFIENGNMTVIQSVVDKLRSSTSDLVSLGDAKAFILTDKAYNIKTLMTIVKELDRVSMPQSMSVMKLYRADATDVKKLFDQLMGTDESKQQQMFMPPRQQPTALYFPQNTRIIAEPRTNSLIILGTPDSIEKIESFISKHVDKDPETPHSPLFYYDLKFAQAKNVKTILENTVGKFGREPATDAGKVGGVRGVDKYVRPMAFIDDPATNRIIMKGDYQDYLLVKDLIAQIDQPQPQVAVEVLVLLVSWQKVKKLGTQIRNYMKTCGGFGSDRVQFQTSGLEDKV
jgi:general secretion pathway protein D